MKRIIVAITPKLARMVADVLSDLPCREGAMVYEAFTQAMDNPMTIDLPDLEGEAETPEEGNEGGKEGNKEGEPKTPQVPLVTPGRIKEIMEGEPPKVPHPTTK